MFDDILSVNKETDFAIVLFPVFQWLLWNDFDSD